MVLNRCGVRRVILTTVAVLASLARASVGEASSIEVYSVSENPGFFGWLDQYVVGTGTSSVGPDACVPTSTTNAMTYLQNAAPSVFGTMLTGSGTAGWLATDLTLITPTYMDTQPNVGTTTGRQFYGTWQYIVDTHGFSPVTQVMFGGQVPADYWTHRSYGAKPAYVQDGYPTWNFIYDALSAGSATIFTIEYAHSGGHCLLAQSFQWTDANGDGIIEKSEDAMLSFVDPLDPAFYGSDNQPIGGPKITSGHIWNYQDAAGGNLMLDYLQYWGELPYESGNYGEVKNATIDTVLSLHVVIPEVDFTGAGGVVAMLVASLGLFERRREPS